MVGRPAGKQEEETEVVGSLAAAVKKETEETPDQKKIRELEAELAQEKKAREEAARLVGTSLTPEQAKIKRLEDQLARDRGARDVPVEFEPPNREAGDTILLHFLEDGFTALGQPWYRGQELEITVGSQSYEDTKDRHGKSWLDYLDDAAAQYDKYGREYFRPGPWPGKSYSAGGRNFQRLKGSSPGEVVEPPSVEELSKAELLELKRARAAPRLPRVQ